MSSWRIITGDVMATLPALPDESVHCCVTSPPYWGLRDYGTATWEGGEVGCDHKDDAQAARNLNHSASEQRQGRTASEGKLRDGIASVSHACRKCGARRIDAQIGLELTPEEYVAKMVAVFREVRRVLRDDGTLWLNLGDSYTSGGRKERDPGQSKHHRAYRDDGFRDGLRPGTPLGLKQKDLCGIPWRVAFALQADGWYLRQDIIWCLSGGTWLYVRTDAGGICLMTVKDLRRLDPATVRLWNGKEWTRMLGMSKSKRRGDELEITLRSGERIACTPTHRFPLCGGFPVKPASELKPGDVLASCRLPEPTYSTDYATKIDEQAAWLCGLYIAEGSRSGDTIQIAGHTKETARWDRIQYIAREYGGTATRTVSGNNMTIRLYGKILNGIIDQFVSGRTAHNKGFSPAVWRCSNNFIRAMVDGYLAGDGHHDTANDRWRLGFCRNYNLERDLRTACARLGYRLVLNLSSVRYKGRDVPAFRGELRTHTRQHPNCKDPNEIVSIGRARCRDVYDLGVADEPHLFALASGILTHNSKPNPMPESVTDRCTKAHEYIFLLSKSARYYYDAGVIAEASVGRERFGNWTDGQPCPDRNDNARQDMTPTTTRNRRSVWTVATKPYPEAHFATFPPDLIEPCILAGCPVDGTVLDPFTGSGTTGEVAIRHGRNFVGCELNPEYVRLAEQRIGEAREDQALFVPPRREVQGNLIGEP